MRQAVFNLGSSCRGGSMGIEIKYYKGDTMLDKTIQIK